MNNIHFVENLTDVAELFLQLEENERVNFGHRDQNNIQCLAQFIGRERLQNICHRAKVSIDFDIELPLCKRDIRKIFIHMLDLHPEDIGGLSSENYLPFTSKEELHMLLLDHAPDLTNLLIDKAQTSGQGLRGLAERVFIQGIHHLQIQTHTDPEQMKLCEAEMLTSRLADREMQEGSIIHLNEGYFVVSKVFVGGGAYISILESLDSNAKPKIVCRGTAMRSTATGGILSGINDLLMEVGLMGIKTIWPAISAYLKHREFEEIEIFGKSLGGAQAQKLTVLIEGLTDTRVVALTTCGSVGVSEAINDLFIRIRAEQNHAMEILVLRNAADQEKDIDLVPCVGGKHIGGEAQNVKVRVCYLHSAANENLAVYTNMMGIFASIPAFMRSFGAPHCRQVTLTNFRYHQIDSDDVQNHLAMGKKLDGIRKVCAYFLHFLTFGLLNGKSFQKFFESHVNFNY